MKKNKNQSICEEEKELHQKAYNQIEEIFRGFVATVKEEEDLIVKERNRGNEILEALIDIIEIGKRDLSNPKYDGYFNTAREVIKKYRNI